MAEVPQVVTDVLKGLKPAGLWYCTVSLMTGLLIWTSKDASWCQWSTPAKFVFWGWVGISALVLPYIHGMSYIQGKLTQRASKRAEASRKGPRTLLYWEEGSEFYHWHHDCPRVPERIVAAPNWTVDTSPPDTAARCPDCASKDSQRQPAEPT